MRRCIVTGSSGFLGRHLINHLAKRSDLQVVGVDILPPVATGTEHHQVDLLDRSATRAVFKGADMVCHLAAMGDVVAAEKNPERTLERNVAATLNVSREAADANAYLIYASTWEVYGQSATASEWGAVDESRYCLPTNYYAATKLSGEHVISATAAISELRYSILRLGTAYGRGMRPHTAIMSFLAAASTGKDIVIAGTGGQTRQFTHIGDICRAFELACDHQPRRALLNIAARRSVSISEVAGVICGHFGVNAVSSAGRHGDPPNAVVDVQAAKVALGWEAAMDFEFGLRELIAEHAVTDSSRP